MLKEKNSPSASHFRKYWSIELALVALVVGWLVIQGVTSKRDYSQVFMPTFLGMEYFRLILSRLVCGSMCLIPFALGDTEVTGSKILGFRISAIIVVLLLIFVGLGRLFDDRDEFYYADMLSRNDKQYFLVEHIIGYDEGSYSEMLFYDCSQFWCDLVYNEVIDKVSMTYEPETKAILLKYDYDNRVMFTYPVP